MTTNKRHSPEQVREIERKKREILDEARGDNVCGATNESEVKPIICPECGTLHYSRANDPVCLSCKRENEARKMTDPDRLRQLEENGYL